MDRLVAYRSPRGTPQGHYGYFRYHKGGKQKELYLGCTNGLDGGLTRTDELGLYRRERENRDR
ncbi:MAG: hypothetical protein ACR2JR_08605 [Rubrobacteraceae bacterium]